MKNISHHFRCFSFSPVHRKSMKFKIQGSVKRIQSSMKVFSDRALNFEFHLPLAKVSEILNSVKSEFLWFMTIFSEIQSSELCEKEKKKFSYHLFFVHIFIWNLFTVSFFLQKVVWKVLSCELEHILNLGLKITRMKRQKY